MIYYIIYYIQYMFPAAKGLFPGAAGNIKEAKKSSSEYYKEVHK